MARETFVLPERFTPEWVAGRVWKPTMYDCVEICELGITRRTRTSGAGAGKLSYPVPNKGFPPRYRIPTFDGGKKKYVVDVSDMMQAVFGRYLNKRLDNYDYLVSLRTLCMEYNTRYYSKSSAEHNKQSGGRVNPAFELRLCAGVNGKSCGRKIRDYRCQACWIMIRGGRIDDMSEECLYTVIR